MITKSMQDRLDGLGGCYTRLLRKTFNIYWTQHVKIDNYSWKLQLFQGQLDGGESNLQIPRGDLADQGDHAKRIQNNLRWQFLNLKKNMQDTHQWKHIYGEQLSIIRTNRKCSLRVYLSLPDSIFIYSTAMHFSPFMFVSLLLRIVLYF